MDETKLQKLATLSHNRMFTLSEAEEYAGVTKPELDQLIKSGLVEKFEGYCVLTSKAYEQLGWV